MKYIQKPTIIEAVQINNFEEVVAQVNADTTGELTWFKKIVEDKKIKISRGDCVVKTDSFIDHVVHAGDYIVKNQDGTLSLYTSSEFEDKYMAY